MTYSDALFSGHSHNALLGSSSWYGGLGRLWKKYNAGKKKEKEKKEKERKKRKEKQKGSNLNVYIAMARGECTLSQCANHRRIYTRGNGYNGFF